MTRNTLKINEFRDLKNKSKGNITIIGGDFNLPDINWVNNSIEQRQYSKKMNNSYLDFIAEKNLEQMVDFPTNKLNTLDIILTSHPGLKLRCKPMPSLGNSVHDIVLYDCALKPFTPKPVKRKIHLWKKKQTSTV